EPQELVAMPAPGAVSAAVPGPARHPEAVAAAASADVRPSPGGAASSGLAAARAAAAALQRGASRRPAATERPAAPQPPASTPPARPSAASLAVTRPVSTSVAVQSPAASREAAADDGPPWQVDQMPAGPAQHARIETRPGEGRR